MIASDTARRRGIDNTPSFEDVFRLDELCNSLLQPLRDAWGDAIIVNSGFRCKELNASLKNASKTSVHQIGYAADIRPSNGDFDTFVSFAKAFFKGNGIKFDQMLIESDGGEKWLHLGLRSNDGSQRCQIKTMNL